MDYLTDCGDMHIVSTIMLPPTFGGALILLAMVARRQR